MLEHRLDTLREALPLTASTGKRLLSARADGVDAPPAPVGLVPAAAQESVVLELPQRRVDRAFRVVELPGARQPYVLDDRVAVHRSRLQRRQQQQLQVSGKRLSRHTKTFYGIDHLCLADGWRRRGTPARVDE